MPKMTRELQKLLDTETEATTRWLRAFILFHRAIELHLSSDAIFRLYVIVCEREAVKLEAEAQVESYG